MRLVKMRGESGERVAWVAPGAQDAPIFVFVEQSALGDGVGAARRADPFLRHLGYEVGSRADLEALHARAEADGQSPTAIETIDEIVGTIFMVRDPDGRVVELTLGQNVGPDAWDRPSA